MSLTPENSADPETAEQAISVRVLIGLLLLAAVAAGMIGYALFVGQGIGGD